VNRYTLSYDSPDFTQKIFAEVAQMSQPQF